MPNRLNVGLTALAVGVVLPSLSWAHPGHETAAASGGETSVLLAAAAVVVAASAVWAFNQLRGRRRAGVAKRNR